MSNNREEILRVSHLKQYFRHGAGRNKIVVKAVDDISFNIYKGEVFSLVGESGCGKTTTGRTIIKLHPSTGGEVYFHGTRIISDVKKAKKDYNAARLELKTQLQAGTITQDEYKEKLAAERDILVQVKRDRRFERYVDPASIQERKAFNQNSPAYIEIRKEYDEQNAELEQKITELTSQVAAESDPATLKDLKRELKDTQFELKMNDKRFKQDIGRHKYELVHRNRLLMRRMQMIFQDPIASLNPRMTVKEIIAEGLRINGLKNEREIDRRVKDALKVVGLVPEHASRYPHEFSGGQRQRIGIARTLVVEPTFIVADEPISALDVSIRAQVINLLNELREEQGITIMFIAHDLSVVKYISDRVAVMYFGKIVEIGDKNKIFDNPMHPYTLSLIDSIPLPDPIYEQARGNLNRYNPAVEHDYSIEGPTLRELEEDHWVLCNTEEFERYKKQLK